MSSMQIENIRCITGSAIRDKLSYEEVITVNNALELIFRKIDHAATRGQTLVDVKRFQDIKWTLKNWACRDNAVLMQTLLLLDLRAFGYNVTAEYNGSYVEGFRISW